MLKKPAKWLIFALGNPGEEYGNTYHNAGVMALPVFIETLAGAKMEELDWKVYKKLFEYVEAPLLSKEGQGEVLLPELSEPPLPPEADPPPAETPPWKGGEAKRWFLRGRSHL